MEQNSVFKKYPLWFELLAGVIFGAVNSVLSTFFVDIKSPIFMDTIFAVTAAFVGWWSGLASVVVFDIMSILKTPPDLRFVVAFFPLCVLAMVVIVRLVYRKRDRVTFISLIFVYVLCWIFVSAIGAVVSTYAFSQFAYPDSYSIKYITMMFATQHIPLIFSAFLSRIPVNALDKLVAVFLGWGIYLLIEKFSRKAKLIQD